ncbi:MAG: hypothetical protein HWD92_07075 [Flavobacteriia bacterium]|nr:hypothetical protein [Flavobacteriia bacterium]
MKVELKKSERFDYWLGMIALPGLLYFIAATAFLSALEEGNVPYISIAITAFALWTSYKYWGLRTFSSFEIKITPEQFKEANKTTAILGDWKILSNSKKKFTAYIGHLSLWEGLRLTAIHTKDAVHINCMPTPSSRAHPFAFRSAKIYVDALREAYKTVAQEEANLIDSAVSKRDRKEQEFMASSEWTAGSIFRRIGLYSLCLIISMVSFIALTEGELVTGISALVFCGLFITVDVLILIKKRKHKKKNA